MRPLRFDTFDRGLRRPSSGWLLALGAALAGSALPSGSPLLLRAIVAGMLGGAVVFARWTWLRLWRAGSGPKEQIVYDHGVRTTGPMLYVVLVISLGFQQSVWDRLQRGTPNAWMQLVILLVISVPLALWTGFAWGQLRLRFASRT